MSILRSHRFVLLAFATVILLTRGFLAFRSEEKLTERPYNDDSYYMMTVGRQIALGNGFSIDGVHPTNGVQPLQCLVYGAVFYLTEGEKFDGVRLSFFFAAIIEIFSMWGIYKFLSVLRKTRTGNDIVPILGAGIWTFLFSNIIHNDNGLETGLYIATIIAAIWQYTRILRMESDGTKVRSFDWILLGALAGITVLARIDAVFFVMALCVTDLWHRRKMSGSRRLMPPITIGIVAFLVSSPWWAFNYFTFGSLMPISGQSESIEHFLPLNLNAMPVTLSDLCLSFFYVPQGFMPGWLQLSVAGCIMILSIVLWKRLQLKEKIAASYELLPFKAMAISSVLIVIYYTFFFSAPHFIGRYFHPVRLLALLAWIVLLPLLYRYIKTKSTPPFHRSIFYCFFAIAIVFNVWHYIHNFTTEKVSAAYEFAEFALPHKDWKVGSTSSGTLGFIVDNTVNLDGKVNYDALRARKENRIGEYVYEAGINVIADWRPTLDSVFAAAERHGLHYKKIGQYDEMEVYARE